MNVNWKATIKEMIKKKKPFVFNEVRIGEFGKKIVNMKLKYLKFI